MSNPKTYKLEKITDVLTVHPDDFDDLLDDLRAYYTLFRPVVESGIGEPTKHLQFTANGKKSYRTHIREDSDDSQR
jgi:hypothetical protein